MARKTEIFENFADIMNFSKRIAKFDIYSENYVEFAAN